ncbi:hypothetical protein Lal_00004102 [Lupinus albus]|nr:hypothetical protein Lal_00004102 [Lupinus albus]
MMMPLKTKNKLQFIDGSLPKLDKTEPLFLAWDRCNTLVLSWINHSIDQAIIQSVLWYESVVQVWEDLKERYYQGDVYCISDLQEQIYGAKQGNRISPKREDQCFEFGNSGSLAQARNGSLEREKPGQAVRFSLERENLAQAREPVSGTLKYRRFLAQARYSRPGESAQL